MISRRTARDYLLEQLWRPNFWQLHQQFPLVCPHCQMAFVHQIHFNSHLRIHRQSSEIQCEECEAVFENIIQLQDHIGLEHSEPRAFPVQFSIAPRISYGPPETSAAGSEIVMLPCNMRPMFNVLIPPDYACQSAFGRHHVPVPPAPPSPTCFAIQTPSAKELRRPLTMLEKLLMRSTTTVMPASTSNSQPSDELIDVLTTPPSSVESITSPLAEAVAFSPPTSAPCLSHDDGSVKLEENCMVLEEKEGQIEKDMTCEHCGKTFFYKCNLSRHLSAIHGERTIKTTTATASKSPRAPFKVGRAEAVPTEKKDIALLKCNFCDRSFTQKSSLVLHKQVHQGPEPYRCSICHGVRFSSRTRMESHMNRHRARAERRRLLGPVCKSPVIKQSKTIFSSTQPLEALV